MRSMISIPHAGESSAKFTHLQKGMVINMQKGLQFTSVLKWLKLFTYFSVVILLITNNSFIKLTYLIPLVLVLFFINYFRDCYLVAEKKPVQFVLLSIFIEMLLILSIGFFSKSDINILLFYVSISSVVIFLPFIFSLCIAAVYVTAQFFLFIILNGFVEMMK
ncbi:MAG: hypothetical protein K0S55_1879, partial [Clostridia bacterium]|nr:hypothetical protein [Clostridia bacterium]